MVFLSSSGIDSCMICVIDKSTIHNPSLDNVNPIKNVSIETFSLARCKFVQFNSSELMASTIVPFIASTGVSVKYIDDLNWDNH